MLLGKCEDRRANCKRDLDESGAEQCLMGDGG
jgi:hypothetical protein